MFFDQSAFRVRCEWGAAGLALISASRIDAVVIVDVLSFSTCVDVATARGAIILPHPTKDASAVERAAQLGALVATSRDHRSAEPDGAAFSLSPASLLTLPRDRRLVLPSPNGATLSALAAKLGPAVFSACLRNASAVARHLRHRYTNVLFVPAGEQWPDGSLRPALEDWIGCGAVIDSLATLEALEAAQPLSMSPEANAARQAYRAARGELARTVGEATSGRELIERGFAVDVEMAVEVDVSDAVPMLRDGEFQNGTENDEEPRSTPPS